MKRKTKKEDQELTIALLKNEVTHAVTLPVKPRTDTCINMTFKITC